MEWPRPFWYDQSGKYQSKKIWSIMAYSNRFTFAFYNQHEKWVQIAIQQKDYEGANTELTVAGPQPVVYKLEGAGGTKFAAASGNVITGSSLQISLVVTNETEEAAFREFSTAPEDEYRVILNYGTGPSSFNQIWYGFLMPEVYEQPHMGYPYFINLTATDGVGRLNGYKFLTAAAARYTTRRPIMYFVFEILNKIGLGLNVTEVLNCYSDEMDATTADSPLTQATVDPTKYINNRGRENETVWNCLEVLNDMLSPFLIRVRQTQIYSNSTGLPDWGLFCVPELSQTTVNARRLTNSTTVSDFNSKALVKQTTTATAANPIRFINKARISSDWRWKRIVLRILTGYTANFFLNGDLNPSSWVSDTMLKNWFEEYRGPSFEFTVKYGATTPFPAVPLYNRESIFEEVDYQAGVYIPDDVPNSTIYKFSASSFTADALTVNTLIPAGVFEIGSAVFFTKANDAVMPLGLGHNRVYYVHSFYAGDPNQLRISATVGGDFIDLTSNGSGDLFIGAVATTNISYAVQINGYQTTFWTTGDITNKNGIKSKPVEVQVGDGTNTMQISFFWKIIFDNASEFQTHPAEAYYQIIIQNGATKYYFNKATGLFTTTPIAMILEDDLKDYEWNREAIDLIEITQDGDLSLYIYQPSSTLNTDTLGIQIAQITADFDIGGVEDIEFIEKVAEVGADYSEEVEPFELLTGDMPSAYFPSHIGVASNLAVNWARRGVTEEKELTDLMLIGMMNNYGRSTITVNGQLYGDVLWDNIIEDANLAYDNGEETITPRLLLCGGEYDFKAGIWSGEYKEIRNQISGVAVDIFDTTFDVTFN
jgi:hypothetical protein